MTMACVDEASLQERLRVAKQEVALARQNEEAVREQIRSIGSYEEDSLLYLCDGEGSPLLTHAMSFLDTMDVGRCTLVCRALNHQAVKCWGNMCKGIMLEIDSIVAHTTITNRGFNALRQFNNVFAKKQGAVQYTILTEQLSNDYDKSMMKVTSILNYALNHWRNDLLIQETITALEYLIRMGCCRSMISHSTVEFLISVIVSALLNRYMNEVSDIVLQMNKLATRAALSPSPDKSLLALIFIQQSVISSVLDSTSASTYKHNAKYSRALEKLSQKVIKNEGLDGLELEDLPALLCSVDWLIETAERVSQEGASGESDMLLRPSKAMTKNLVFELVKCKGGAVREVVESLDSKFIEPILSECEQMVERGEEVYDSSNWRVRLAQLRRTQHIDVIW